MKDVRTRTNARHLTNSEDCRCKLSESDIEDIKYLRDCGYLMKELAAMYKVHADTIRFVLRPEMRNKKNAQVSAYYHRQREKELIKNETK